MASHADHVEALSDLFMNSHKQGTFLQFEAQSRRPRGELHHSMLLPKYHIPSYSMILFHYCNVRLRNLRVLG